MTWRYTMRRMDALAAPRILFVNQSSEIGGGELALLDFVAKLPNAQVVVFSDGPFLGLLRDAGVAASVADGAAILQIRRNDGVLGAMRSLPGGLALSWRLLRLARQSDLVYANSQKAFVVCAVAARLVRRPLIWHLHDILSVEHFSSGMRRFSTSLANRFATLVIANSAATADAFRAAGGKAPVEIVHNGINPEPFGNGSDTVARVALAAKIGSGNAQIIGVFGRLAAWKGQDVVVRALLALPDHHLILVGGALFGEDAYEARLRGLVDELNLSRRVHFFGFRDDVAALMRAVDVVVHSSIAAEPFGRVIVEGMMAGAPVVATASGGALEIVNHEVTGILVPPGDIAALSTALRQLSDNPSRARDIADAGREHAMRHFGLQASVERLKDITSAVFIARC